jgi:hypothetical protein
MKWGKTYSKKKKIFLETFNDEKWTKMADNKKEMHCLNYCQGCLLDYRNIMTDLPMTKYWGSISKNPLDDLHSNMSRSQLNNITNKIYNEVNESFEKTCGFSFAEAQCNVKDIGLSYRKTKYEREIERRKTIKKVKEIEENASRKNAVVRYEIINFIYAMST